MASPLSSPAADRREVPDLSGGFLPVWHHTDADVHGLLRPPAASHSLVLAAGGVRLQALVSSPRPLFPAGVHFLTTTLWYNSIPPREGHS